MSKWALTFALLLVAAAAAQTSCDAGANRIDCKQYNQAQCVAEGCCWDEVNPNPSNVPWCFYENSGSPSCAPAADRLDCGYAGISQSECEGRDCCWNEVSPNPNNVPYCYQSNMPEAGYKVTAASNAPNGGKLLTLEALNPSGNMQYGAPISPLQLQASFDTNSRLHVKIIDPNAARWEVPQWLFPRADASQAPPNPEMSFSYTSNPFGFAVTRLADNVVVFNSTVPGSEAWSGLQFKDQFLSLTTQLATNSSLYGLQESTQSAGFKLTPKTYTLWNHDTPAAATNTNLYGSHPFYLEVINSGKAHGVFLLNSNGMDVDYADDHLTYKTVGGVLDFYFFSGPSPDAVVQQYNQLIGLPVMQPYWALGFHQCRYGMPNLAYVEGVVANYSAANIPLDTMWGDIDYMDAYKDFTWDPVNYPLDQVQTFTSQLHSQHQQYVVILDPGILKDPSYSSYTALIANTDAYIKDVDGNPFVGQVWPGYTIFPDFLTTAGQDYWNGQLETFLTSVPYDGLWVDMNEASNFCSGECLNGSPIPLGSTTCGCQQTTTADFNGRYHPRSAMASGASNSSSFDPMNPPYAINNNEVHNPLNNKAIDPNAYHMVNGEQVLEYDAHNLLGLAEARQTHLTLAAFHNKRPFVLTRSSFASSGNWTAKWTGDNSSDWPDLYYSILGMLNFNILGVPMIGADICGFNGATTEELCARWIELGAFYPFSRNHNAINEPVQELYRWPTVSAISSYILRVRYALLPLYYTLNYHASTQGSAIVRPLFFEFPSDAATLGLDAQFLVGDALMVAPVLQQGATQVSVYFPAAVWYDFYTYEQMVVAKGTTQTVAAPLDFIPLYILGGSVITRRSEAQLTTFETNQSPFNLTVAFNQQLQASGDLFVDDGTTLDYKTDNLYVQFSATATNGKGSFSSKVVHSALDSGPVTAVNAVTFLGVPFTPTQVTVNGASWTSFSMAGGALTLSQLELNVAQTIQISFF